MSKAFTVKNGDKILFLGEGNFSFSQNFVQKCYYEDLEVGNNLTTDVQIFATCLQEEKVDATEVRSRNISYLQEHGVKVLHCVDATKIHENPFLRGQAFTKVVFMFPHVGGKMKIHLNRELLQGIFESSQHVLDTEGILIITLCAGQGGTPYETKIRRNDDTWKILEISQDCGFCLVDIGHFPAKQFPEYSQVGYRSLQKGFNIQDSIVHVFQKGDDLPYKPIQDLETIDVYLSTKENKHKNEKNCRQLYPLTHQHHLSFWCDNQISETELQKIGEACLGEVIQQIQTIDRYKDPCSGRTSQTISVVYQSLDHPVGPKRSYHLHYHIFGQSLANVFKVKLR
eukprot:TRINITY_DN4759_c0_g1_i1.p1 TRINITY_DN4759_c0_g1~~TRINITY_DN4759_c0_g1_i1.p1  ORF type:complete len:341 (-),score=10.65 TRINITY_DN4759_c0_g1_i1:110-1132(-)